VLNAHSFYVASNVPVTATPEQAGGKLAVAAVG